MWLRRCIEVKIARDRVESNTSHLSHNFFIPFFILFYFILFHFILFYFFIFYFVAFVNAVSTNTLPLGFENDGDEETVGGKYLFVPF